MARARVVATVRGRVQGVGFRAWVARRATGLGLAGSARNAADGSVEVVAQGERDDVRALVDALRADPARPGRVVSVEADWAAPVDGVTGFRTS